MAKSTKRRVRIAPPVPENTKEFSNWLSTKPAYWSVAIAARATLRALPLLANDDDFDTTALPAFRAAAISCFAAKYQHRAIADAAAHAADAADAVGATYATDAAYCAFCADSGIGSYAVAAALSINRASNAAGTDSDLFFSAVDRDVEQLRDAALAPNQLASSALWPSSASAAVVTAWGRLRHNLLISEEGWDVWIAWYEKYALEEPLRGRSENEDAAFTDLPGKLPWDEGAKAVNEEIARRLEAVRREANAAIPDQSPAPVRVEERDGKIAKYTDRDSPLLASERDFSSWRDPVVEHVDELSSGDFRAGTNHGRVRDRLMALGRLLPGEIADVKERQFRIGYEIERFEGLLAAYRSGGDDMPSLNAAQLEDLERLRVALKMGVDKLERWSEFRRQANESPAREGEANGQAVADTLDEMAAIMEQRPEYFHPEMPESFRFLAEAARDLRGATKTVVYGAIKSAENLLSFLGQRALGIGKKGTEALEVHISKAVAATLITGFSGAALQLSGVLPQGWAWLKPLLTALGVGG